MKKQKEKKEESVIVNILIGLGRALLILGAIYLIFGVDWGSKDDDDLDKLKIEECINRSDTYHKCSWSALENRCVCKQR